MIRHLLVGQAMACALLFGSVRLHAQGVLRPIDEAARVPDFLAFRTQLQAAVARRDVAAVTAVLHPDVKLSFGGDEGSARFAPLWSPQSPDSRLWETLGAVLALGGTFSDDTTFTAPYVFTRWPQEVDAFEHVAIVGRRVRVRERPRTTAAVIASLDYAIVRLADASLAGASLADASSADEDWVHVRLTGTRSGYVHRRHVRSPVDYRVQFVKQHGRWRIVYFLAGD